MDLDRIRYLYDGLPAYDQARFRLLLYHFWKPVEVNGETQANLVSFTFLVIFHYFQS